MSGLDGKVCVVTGAGAGVGRALARELAHRGVRLALSDVDEAALTQTAEIIGAGWRGVHTQRPDVFDRDAFVAYGEAVAAHFGVVHQIYNNAGIALSRPVLDSDWSDYERVPGINLWGVLHGTKVFLPHLIASGDGHVVNISSLNGIMAQPELSHYSISKFGVRGFTESLRMELERYGHPVRTTVVHPGGISTNIARAALDSARSQGTVTEADEKRAVTHAEKFLKMDPSKAARIIVDGVAAKRSRVLAGNDAKLMDALVRLVPALYPRLVRAGERRTHG